MNWYSSFHNGVCACAFLIFLAACPVLADDTTPPGDSTPDETESPTEGCNTKFVNPFTDVAWECLYPIRMAGFNISPSGPDPESRVEKMLCSCQDGAFNRIGVTVGFREPARLMDVTKMAFCMAALGFSLGQDSLWAGGSQKADAQVADTYTAQTHYYYFNPLVVMEILLDFSCMEKVPLDVAGMSELDPLADDDELSLLAMPETVLFANPVAVLACAADAIAATVGVPIDALYWCAGSWGTVYPLVNKDEGNIRTGVQASALVASKQLARGHRELINWGTKGEAAMCGPYPMPIWMKTQYRLQMVEPTLMSSCIPVGRTSLLWEQNKSSIVPGKADHYVYLIWRYRDCCILN